MYLSRVSAGRYGFKISPGESDLDRLDRIFRCLTAQLSAGQRPEISVLVFVPDARKAGGRYETVTGRAVMEGLSLLRAILSISSMKTMPRSAAATL